MDKENLFETSNENEEVINEATEEAAEVIEEAAEELAGEAEEAIAEAAETDEYDMEETIVYDEEAILEEPEKKLSKGVIAAVAAAAAVVVILAGLLVYGLTANKYNHLGFLDISGTTVGEVCEQSGYAFEQFLTDYSLPADLPQSTTMNAAFSMLPVKTYAAMYNTDFATLKEGFGIPDTIPNAPITIWEKLAGIFVKKQVEVTEDTPWGFVLNNITLDKVYGENFEAAKEHYGFGDKVTPETLYGDVRKQIEKKDMEERIAADEEAARLEEEAENADDDAVEDEAAEGAAEGTAAEGGETENAETAE